MLYNSRSPVKVPIASEDVGDNDLDCIRCEGCSKAMLYGNVRSVVISKLYGLWPYQSSTKFIFFLSLNLF